MTHRSREAGSPHAQGGLVAFTLIAIVFAGVVASLYGPLLPMALTGDSYQWIQHAHVAAHKSAVLLADLDTFFRPSTTWTLVVDRFVWGGFNARGYRTTSLALHGLAALALVIVGRRLGLGWLAAAAVGLVWVTSPFSDESAIVVAYRFQPLLLLSWLVLIIVWPRQGESWCWSRLAAAVVAVVAGAASKETWVVTPALVAALEFERQRTWRSAVVPAVTVTGAVVAYLAFYFIVFPGSKSYFELGPHIVAKLPRQMAAFLFFQESTPGSISLTWQAVAALVVFGTLIAACVKWRVPGTLTALCLFVLPTMPTILVPFLPQRYLAIPYAGFLLMVALWVSALSRRFPKWRVSIQTVAMVAAVLVAMVGATIVRADIEDYQAITASHALLLEQTAAVVAHVKGDAPLAVVIDEKTSPLVEVAQFPVGYPKLVFVRNHDPYGLIDTAALFEWVLADEGTRVEHVVNWTADCEGVPGVVLVHSDGGFIDLATAPNLASEAAKWQASGRSVRVVRATALD